MRSSDVSEDFLRACDDLGNKIHPNSNLNPKLHSPNPNPNPNPNLILNLNLSRKPVVFNPNPNPKSFVGMLVVLETSKGEVENW